MANPQSKLDACCRWWMWRASNVYASPPVAFFRFENLFVARCRHDWELRTSLAK